MDKATIDFSRLQNIVGLVGERGRQAMVEIAPAIAEALHAEVLEVFETKGYGKWPGYWWETQGLPKPAGRRWQGSPKMLQDSGVLVGSLEQGWNSEAAEVFTDVPYAKFHVSPEPRSKIPLRDFFDIDTDAFESDVADMLLTRLDRPQAAE